MHRRRHAVDRRRAGLTASAPATGGRSREAGHGCLRLSPPIGTPAMSADNNRTLLIAFAANLGIAASKFVSAMMTGSSAMLTEGVHSLVDSANQLLLIWGRRQSRKPPDK